MRKKSELLLRESLPNFYKESLVTDDINQAKFEELLVYNFDILASATDNFHLSSKLGQGGFGPVYKVMFSVIESFIIFFRIEIDGI